MTCTGPRPVGTDAYLTDADRERLAQRRSGLATADLLAEAADELRESLAFDGKKSVRAKRGKGAMPRMAMATRPKPRVVDRLVALCPVGRGNALPVSVLATAADVDTKMASTLLINAHKEGLVLRVQMPRTEATSKYGRKTTLCYYRR
jgi:hypothetical protein